MLETQHGGSPRRRRVTRVIVAVAALGLLAACGSGGGDAAGAASATSAPTSTAAVDEQARALLPEDVRAGGELRMASAFAFKPFSYTDDSGGFTGAETELGDEIAARLGLTPRWDRVESFSALVPAVQSGRFHASLDGISSTPARLEVVDFVDYQQLSWAIMVRSGNPTGVNGNDPCGVHWGGTTGQFEVTGAQQMIDKCTAAGKPGGEVTEFAQLGQLQALASGQVDAVLENATWIQSHINDQPETFEMLVPDTQLWDPLVGGAAVQKLPGLKEAIADVAADIQADGTYDRIYDKYDIPAVDRHPAQIAVD